MDETFGLVGISDTHCLLYEERKRERELQKEKEG